MWKSFIKQKNKVLSSLFINVTLLCIEIIWLSLSKMASCIHGEYIEDFLIGGGYDICSRNKTRVSLSESVWSIIHPKSRSYMRTSQCPMELTIWWSGYFPHFLTHSLNLLLKRLNVQFNRTLLSRYTCAKISFIINE